MAEDDKKPFWKKLNLTTVGGGLLLAVFLYLVILPAFGGLSGIQKIVQENAWKVLALVAIGVVFYLLTKKSIEMWEGPGGIELLIRALEVCPEFKYNNITWTGIPKGKNEMTFQHDQKNQIFHYYLRLSHDDNIMTGLGIAYDPRKTGDWAPKVKYMRGVEPVNLDAQAKKGGKAVVAEHEFFAAPIEETEEVGE